MHDSKNMPDIVEVTDPKAVLRYGDTKMLIAPPLAYDEIIIGLKGKNLDKLNEGKAETIKDLIVN